jgi:hypothetical protein
LQFKDAVSTPEITPNLFYCLPFLPVHNSPPWGLCAIVSRGSVIANSEESFSEENIMVRRNILLATASAAILAFATIVPASALDVSIGGGGGGGGASVSSGSGSNGGTHVGAKAGNTSVNASLGGGSDIGSTSVGTGSNSVGARVGTGGGSLVGLSSSGGSTSGSVNLGLGGALNGPLNGVTGTLGSTLDGTNIPGGGGGGAITPRSVNPLIAGLSPGEVDALQTQCSRILKSPGRFETDLVSLCVILAKLSPAH